MVQEGPGTIFLDFDETLTQADTCVEFSAMAHPEQGLARQSNQLLYARLARDYGEARSEFLARHVPRGRAAKFDPDLLRWFLKESSTFDRAMMEKVEESGVLEGITVDQITRQAAEGESELQVGVAEFLNAAHAAKYGLVVSSNNWSRRYILGVLAKGFNQARLRLGDDWVTVYANELVMDPVKLGCTGRTDHANATVDSKGMRVRLHKMGVEGWSCFVGNSEGDIAAMMQCNVGIIVGPVHDDLAQIIEGFGMRLLPLEASSLRHGRDGRDRPDVWTLLPPSKGVLHLAADWAEVARVVLGQDIHPNSPARAKKSASGIPVTSLQLQG